MLSPSINGSILSIPTIHPSPSFNTKLGRHKGGLQLLAAVGFCDELQAEAGKPDTSEAPAEGAELDKATLWKERKGWLVLEGSIGRNGKPVATVGEAQLKVLRAARQEVKQ